MLCLVRSFQCDTPSSSIVVERSVDLGKLARPCPIHPAQRDGLPSLQCSRPLTNTSGNVQGLNRSLEKTRPVMLASASSLAPVYVVVGFYSDAQHNPFQCASTAWTDDQSLCSVWISGRKRILTPHTATAAERAHIILVHVVVLETTILASNWGR